MNVNTTGNEFDCVSGLLRQHVNTAKVGESTDSLQQQKTSSLLGIIVSLSYADKRGAPTRL